ncbi:MAG: PQQ-binding-like beta-propeller repeat protein, partial [Acidobacteriota bacterium]|nr:PQQ-binding-like beta-propeller repeat protein [Acidobacteriota bacterium]
MMNLTRCSPLACAVAVVALGGAPQTAAVDENWAQWRGPDGLGVAAGTSYPEEWSPAKNVAWKVPVEGRGHSSPVIWGDHLFLTTSIKGEQVAGRTAP